MNDPAGKRILLVDDDAALRDMYVLILGKAGWQVTTADNGAEGLAKIREGGWDLILLDMMMPVLDGMGALKALTEEAGKHVADTPIVILSNAGYEEVAKEATDLGAAGFLMKADLLPKDLVEAVQGYLK